MNFGSQEQIRQIDEMGVGPFKRASDVAGGIGRVADELGGIFEFYRGPGGAKRCQNKRGLVRSATSLPDCLKST